MAPQVDLVCLWNGEGGDGPGGTKHMMEEVGRGGGTTRWLDTTKLWGCHPPGGAPRDAEGGENGALFHDHALWTAADSGSTSSNAPGEIDFNALWDRAFAPTIQSLGYDPVRADQDTGALSSIR